jgi:hypothetical protein
LHNAGVGSELIAAALAAGTMVTRAVTGPSAGLDAAPPAAGMVPAMAAAGSPNTAAATTASDVSTVLDLGFLT